MLPTTVMTANKEASHLLRFSVLIRLKLIQMIGISSNKPGMKMPAKYVVEMFCDRVAASKIYRGREYDDADGF